MNTLANWQRKANSGTLVGTDNYSPDLAALQAENKELKKQRKIAQEEREIHMGRSYASKNKEKKYDRYTALHRSETMQRCARNFTVTICRDYI